MKYIINIFKMPIQILAHIQKGSYAQMKIVCKKTNLLNGVQIVSKAVPSKTTMSILECILIDVRNGEIKLVPMIWNSVSKRESKAK